MQLGTAKASSSNMASVTRTGAQGVAASFTTSTRGPCAGPLTIRRGLVSFESWDFGPKIGLDGLDGLAQVWTPLPSDVALSTAAVQRTLRQEFPGSPEHE